MAEMKKILFAGIDNAGKTSIIHVLKKNYSFLNKLKPTRGIERSKSKILEIEFVLWDLGGQEQYITEYFEKKEFIFMDLSLLFFVIDMQDEMRYDSVLSYFEKIISVLREYNQSPNIVVFMHKIDPDIEHNSNIQLFVKDITKKVKKLAGDFNVAFFQTSIFKRWTIISAFSYGIRTLSAKKSLIKLSDYLEGWANYFGATSLLLMSSDDIIIGDFSKDDKSATILNQYLNELLKIYSVSRKPVVLRMNGDLLTLNSFDVGKLTLFLIKYTNNPQITEKDFTKPIPLEKSNEFEDLLLNFFQKV